MSLSDPVKPNTFVNGATEIIDAPEVNANFDTIYAAVVASNAVLNAATASKTNGTLVLRNGSGAAALDVTGNASGLDGANRIPFAAKAAYRGALVYNSGSTGTDGPIAFASESYDTDSIHDNVTNNSRLTVPTGVTRVRLTGACRLALFSGETGKLGLYKNGLYNYVGATQSEYYADEAAGAFADLRIISPVLTVSAGDYFTINWNTSSTGSLIADADGTSHWFAMEIIE